METVGLIVFYVVIAMALLSLPFGIPGTVIIWIDALIYGVLTQFERISGELVVGLLVLTIVAEMADNLMSAAGAKKYGTSKKGIVASLVGGLIGALSGSHVAPLLGAIGLTMGPVGAVVCVMIGPVLGAFAGAFVGVVLVELRQGKDRPAAFRAGLGAMLGRFAGIVLKLALAVVMVVLIVRALGA